MPTTNTYRTWSSFLTVLFAINAAEPAFGQSGITDLGGLNGGTFSWGYGVSADGSVGVGKSQDSPGGPFTRAFRWTQGGGLQSLGALNGGNNSVAYAASSDGSVIVGGAEDGAAGNDTRAFRWTQAAGMTSLGPLSSEATGVSADGSVIVGWATGLGAFRWTQATGMTSLGVLNGGLQSRANAISADGLVIVGGAGNGAAGNQTTAFRWTQTAGMTSLGYLNGGPESEAYAVSSDGSIIVGIATDGLNGQDRAFRWTEASGMQSLGTLNGGRMSKAFGVSANGQVVVGLSLDGPADNAGRAFRWTAAGGMQKVEDWLRANGVSVSGDVTAVAFGTNIDGSVVVGTLRNGYAFIARVASAGNGLITLSDVSQSLRDTAAGGAMTLRGANLVLQGAHSQPLLRRVTPGQKAFWLAGDWGRDDVGSRRGSLGLAEVGGGYNLGPVQINLALGQTWARQDLSLNGRTEVDGSYVMGQALLPISPSADGGLWATLEAYRHWGDADTRRNYLNAGTVDRSSGTATTNTWGLRARLDWENAVYLSHTGITPYADVSYSRTKAGAYTESGGGFPAYFNARQEDSTELRLGLNTSSVLPVENARLLSTLEAVHRFETHGARTSGQMIGLFGFDLEGQKYHQDWLRLGLGVEGKLGAGRASVMINGTTAGEAPNVWLAASYTVAF